MAGTAGETDRSRADGMARLAPEPGATGLPESPAPQGEGDAILEPSVAGGDGAPRHASAQSAPRRRLSAAWRIFRKVAMIGPSYEELRRMEEEDRRANTEWLPGGRIGLVHGFSEFGARREDWDDK